MRVTTKIFISFSFLISFKICLAQTAGDIKLALDIREPQPEEATYQYQYEGKNEARELTALLFSGYKYLISSQDQQSCNFDPSCSVYALHSIKSRGFAAGFLNTFDRLTRCHPLSLDQYARNPQNGLALDPVQ